MNIDHNPSSFDRTHLVRFRGEADWRRFLQTEWLITDGLGGFAMGTALGVNTRRYHGWLISALKPPLGRTMLLNTALERLTLALPGAKEETLELSNFEFAGDHIAPRGHRHLTQFERGVNACRWWYRFGQFTIERQVSLRWRVGGADIGYRVQGPSGAKLRLAITPLVRLHDFHHLIRCDGRRYRVSGTADGITIGAEGGVELHLATSGGQFHAQPDWWFNFHYAQEQQRGLDCTEDLYAPGEFRHECVIDETGSCEFQFTACAASGNSRPAQDAARAGRIAHIERLDRHIVARAPSLAHRLDLAAAADDFVVPRRVGDETLMTILAGYPWFGDWGRDTMIALRGLLLVTGRFEEAFQTLRAFAAHRRRGLIPNLFDDYGGAAHYNTVDASLWFVHAACEYRRLSGDTEGFDRALREACLDIIEHYRRGTDFGIRMDPDDGLIVAGDASTQLTWMDAKRDGVVFTPRFGKPVEINALWFNALRSMSAAGASTVSEIARELDHLADRVAERFTSAFWCEETGCLADVLTPDGNSWSPDRSIRPNQIFACSLPHSPLEREHRARVVAAVEEHLLTPVGLRTLSPHDSRYRPRFEGRMFDRDGAYHQGTVWPWLLGPFVEAVLRLDDFSSAARQRARAALQPLLEQTIIGRSLGQLAEVYDGESTSERPRLPGGCPAQAWSVAAVIDGLALCDQPE